MTKSFSVSSKSIAALALLIWLAIGGLLGSSIVGSLSFALQVGLCFLVGYAVVSFWRLNGRPVVAVLAAILGLEIITSIYALSRFYGSSHLHLTFVSVAAAFGAYRLVQAYRYPREQRDCTAETMLENHALWCGIIVMLAVGSAFYFSGRLADDGLVFYGPMSRDQIFHLAMIARLEYLIPPDNFVVAGYPFPAYHFFSDVAQVMFDRGFWQSGSTLDIFYRLYPALLLFAMGFLAFWVPAKFCASRIAGAIGAAVILFGADFSWLLGILQTVKALPNVELVKQKIFEPWVFWSAFSQLYPLVHRPAYYHGLLMFLAGLACIAGRDGKRDRSWIVAGLIWGLMAGFNYTLAVTMGVAVICGAAFYIYARDRDRVRQFAIGAASLVLGSLPANVFILGSLDGSKANSLFSLAPGALATGVYGSLFNMLNSSVLVFLSSTIVFIVVCYGLKLAGLWPMLSGTGYRFRSNIPAMTIILNVFAISFALGFLLNTNGSDAVSVILFQPTGWILGLYAVYPIFRWINRGRTRLRYPAVAVLLLIGPLQALPLFNLGYKVTITPEFLSAMRKIKAEANPSDVVAFLPDAVQTQPILGAAPRTNNFYVAAFTGLRGYYTTRAYTARDSGLGAAGDKLYDERTSIIEKFLAGTIDGQDIHLLIHQGVTWVILPVKMSFAPMKDVNIWMSGADFTILKLNASGESMQH
jgi:hypothetical protein